MSLFECNDWIVEYLLQDIQQEKSAQNSENRNFLINLLTIIREHAFKHDYTNLQKIIRLINNYTLSANQPTCFTLLNQVRSEIEKILKGQEIKNMEIIWPEGYIKAQQNPHCLAPLNQALFPIGSSDGFCYGIVMTMADPNLSPFNDLEK